MRTLSLILFSLLCSAAYAEPPKAVITYHDGSPAPTKLTPGQIFMLDRSQSVGDKFSWKVRITLADTHADRKMSLERLAHGLRSEGWKVEAPTDRSGDLFTVLDDKRFVLMPSLPGKYHVILVAANATDDPDVEEYDLVIEGNTPGPGPVPPLPIPIPDVTPVGISAAVAAEVAKVVNAETRDAWLRLAEALDKVATLADSGALTTVESFVGTSKIFEDVSLSTSASAGSQWATIKQTTIEPRLKPITVVEYSKGWREIAAGVKTGAGAQPPPTPPGPGPTPPAPVPPAPIPSVGLKVVIIEESSERGTLPPTQAMIFSSTKVLGWLESNAPKKYRIWDKDVDINTVPEEFKDALRLPRTKLPWIVITNGTTGASVPLPNTAAETVSLLEKYKP